MECPKCQEKNPNEAYYCHMCGHQLRRKINGWLITSCALLLLILGLILFFYKELNLLSRKVSQAQYEMELMESELLSRDEEINTLKSKLPQIYYTKYKDQTLYYWEGNYKQTSYVYSEKGVMVNVYLQKDGYGLTEFGWIPMNRLRK